MKLYLRTIVILVLIFPTYVFASAAAHKKAEAPKPVIVLIHAFPTDHRLYEPQINGLKKQFKVIAIDLKGFGKAAETDGSAVSMTDYALQIKQELDKAHIQKAIIGGESMGGYIALAFLQNYPERVRGLILSDTQSIADTDQVKAKREATAQEILTQGTQKLVMDFMPKALSPNADKNIVVYLRDIIQDQKATAIASALRGMALRADTSSVLSAAKIPVLIIYGDKDVVIPPEQSKKMHALANGSKLVAIAGAGHLSNLENPGEWNKAVKEMFAHFKKPILE